ncbi:MAG: DUF5724 domain-containing protein [Phycisphaerales bacterium]|nr:DUF4132 domain-containing protein [Phycisphaerales bacterium]
MDHDQIKESIQKLREPNWIDRRLEALRGFPKPDANELKRLIGSKSISMLGDRQMDGRIENTAKLLDRLKPKERKALWNGLFPKMAQHFECAWTDAVKRPYGIVYGSSPFRAPHRKEEISQLQATMFLALCNNMRGLDPEPAWLAENSPFLEITYLDLGAIPWLLASVLRSGGPDADAVRAVLMHNLSANAESGSMSQHTVSALLSSDKRSDWEPVGNLLLAAQRQEGLRQSILEGLEEAHPDAFRYMLGLILDHDLGRFSSVVSIFDRWLGFQWAGGSAKVVHEGIELICKSYDDSGARTLAVKHGSANDAYIAMWTAGLTDVDDAIKHAASLIADDDVERRYAALTLFKRANVSPESVTLPGKRFISGTETDDRMLMAMCQIIGSAEVTDPQNGFVLKLFDAAGKLFARTPKRPVKLKPIVWPWAQYTQSQQVVAQALRALANKDPKKLIPYAEALDAYDCTHLIERVAGIPESWRDQGDQSDKKRRKLNADERSFIVRMMVDTRSSVHETAFRAIRNTPVTDDEVKLLTSNLHRTSATFRRCAISRLHSLPGQRALEVSASLIEEKHVKKRAAGLELAGMLAKDEQWAHKATALVERYAESFGDNEQLASAASQVVNASTEEITLDDCLGLVPEGSRATPITLNRAGVARETSAAEACLASLVEVFLAHGETEIDVVREHEWQRDSGERKQIAAYFPSPMRFRLKENMDTIASIDEMPLLPVWKAWFDNRDESMRDPDGLELLRVWAMAQSDERAFQRKLPTPFQARMAWDLQRAFNSLVDWLPLFLSPDTSLAYLVQRAEDATVDLDLPAYRKKERKTGGTKTEKDLNLITTYQWKYLRVQSEQHASLFARAGALEMLAMDAGVPGCESGPSLKRFYHAFDCGLLNEFDFVSLLLKRRGNKNASYSRYHYGPIDEVTRLKVPKELVERPVLAAMVQRVRERVIEIELTRGEIASLATEACAEIKYAGGADVLFRAVSALGKDKLVRHDQWGEPTRSYSFSRLISITMPTAQCTDEVFAALIDSHRISVPRMIEIAMFAPQWAGNIERATQMQGLEDAVWWVHGHTKRRDDWRREDIREVWTAQIKERTELDAEDLEEGAVDVAWFGRLIDSIGSEQWEKYQKPAKYASSSGGHKRAQLFANAMLDRVTTDELLERIDTKRNQDAVRALGLVPLPKNANDATAETLRRYVRLQEFKRESRKFGSQRQASEGRAVDIGTANLARTAGYRDPRRLEWAIETEAVADLAKGPVIAIVDAVSVSLAITADGVPELTILKGDKQLKSVPAKIGKQPKIAELKSRVTLLRRQLSRMRLSLETSMCRGDVFTGEELVQLCAHPMLRQMIERLVFVDADKPVSSLAGYPRKEGHLLQSHDGSIEPVSSKDTLRIAHPTDLFARKNWHDWQRDCLAAERVQPFKQVFRELYVRTDAESHGAEQSRRYAGHQVNPHQALALLKQRQWVIAPEEGVRRVYHDEKLIAELWFQEHFYTPAEVDGLTLESIMFRRRASMGETIPLANIPERIFSETMRDLDLVVSVAHMGGVDPEASASTIEMRSSLVTETARLLQLDNVRVDGHHVMIDGSMGRYSVHLGSAETQVIPGRALVIVAVHSQYRGRLFLPFADDDPKTAEVMAKTLLLARDADIKDPSILHQIRM